MASQLRPYSPPRTRARRARDASSADRLPEHVLYSVLQLLPAKDLCRLRTVCKSWRSVTSDAAFIREHAGRHREPLFLAKFRHRHHRKQHVYVVDLSGNVVKRLAGVAAGAAADPDGGFRVLRTRLSLACLATERNACRVLDPATGAIQVLPPVPAVVDTNNGVILRTNFALGLVASTGEYKVLCCWRPFCQRGLVHGQQLQSGVHVLTISGGGSGTDHGQWRPRPGARLAIDMRSGAVVGGVVYFLTSAFYYGAVPADYILSFDLATEEWRTDLHGPLTSAGYIISGVVLRTEITLADLEGSLVLALHARDVMDIWFLLDSGFWVERYRIRTGSVTSGLTPGYQLIPLLVLDDGRLVIHQAPTGLLFICDPGTNAFTVVSTRHRLGSVGVYAGSLLH